MLDAGPICTSVVSIPPSADEFADAEVVPPE
jgi:hypothetical protein